ncbi:MAG: hypothetical protein HW398_893 [Acidobacteria bacterium]|nr:hypothetical protein [Acidobacteriota bacterium]
MEAESGFPQWATAYPTLSRAIVRTVLSCLGIVLAGAIPLEAARLQSPTPVAPPGTPYRVLLNRYCVTCHNEKLKTAGLTLDTMDVGKVSEGAAVWEKVIRKLRTGAMPPAGAPRPDQPAYDSFATYLETEIDRAAAARPNPGRPVVHRLNRAEYANAIRDLLAMEIDGGALLPPDDSRYGFDNLGDVLSVSPLLLERYMAAARKISRLAIGDSAMRPVAETYDVSAALTQEDRMSDALPFGSRGGIAVRHHFPLDGEYVLRIRLQRTQEDLIIGLAEPHQLDVRLDHARIKLFTVGGEFKGKPESLYSEYYADNYLFTADESLEVRFPVKAGTRRVGVAFVKKTEATEGPFQPRPLEFRVAAVSEVDKPTVASVTIRGPYEASGPGETLSRGQIFVCRPAGSADEEPCAKKILSTLARRAYRRPVTNQDLQTLLSFYESGRSEGGFEAGIGMALERMLVSPEFLFRIERDPAPRGGLAAGTAYRINDLDLASRLSFFLWSSIPDNELLELAQGGKLSNPAVLEQQVRRMLGDPRSKTLVSNFAGQWLYLRNLRGVSPDPNAFPDFDENLREAFRQETELFFESIIREDRSALDLLNADYTFLNERLAQHYQIPNISGSHFRRVTLRDEKRRGLLGQGSILTVTSYPNRTSPTLRGKWLLDNFLGTPPPPPPPDVTPTLTERDKDGKVLSVRQQMEQHRTNPICASCHARMDPLGFALENFDAIGKWRTTDANLPINASGALPGGAQFEGPAGLRKLLVDKDDEFVTTLTEKLLTFAMGRGVEYYDQPAVRRIVRAAAPSGYRWSSLMVGIVKSTPFQMRRSP